MDFIHILILSFFQSGAYIISSRARNSNSILYDVIATLIFNVVNIFILKLALADINRIIIPLLIGTSIGTAFFHWFIMKYIEKYFEKLK